ncbi:MAG: SpoIIE family protein phosphatase [Planctomycetales bacterium]|nr:SpoIIE family protein phosphatase [Planctomycetales bacterium]
MAFLIVESAPELGPPSGTKLELGDGIKLGRHPACHTVLRLDAVSREHAEIRRDNGKYVICDLASRNGTYVNDQRLPSNEPHQLSPGDRVSICDVVLTFHDDQAPPPSGAHLLSSGSSLSGPAITTPAAQGAIMVDDEESSSNSTIMSKLDVSSGSTGVQVSASPEVKLAALAEIMQSLGKAVALDDVLPQVLRGLFKIFVQADRGFIVLKQEDGSLVPRFCENRRGEDDTIRISKTIVKQVIESKEAILSADAASDQRFEMSQSIADFRIRSMMCAPLLNSDGEAIGVLQIDTLDQRKRFAAEDLEVLASVAVQAGIAINNAQLHEAAMKQQVMDRDLELAHEVQRSFLPNSRPQFPDYEFYDYYEPANKVGGDYYDYIPLTDGRLAVIVADVVGHGVAAALLMAKLSAEARFNLARVDSPSTAITLLNDSISHLQVDRFVTLIMVVLDPVAHELTLVNAGHMCPIIRRQSGAIDEPGDDEGGPPVGVIEGFGYEQLTIPIAPGETVVLYTDGLNESMKDDQLYGIERIREHVRADENIHTMGAKLIDDIRAFVGDNPQDDDMCLVAFRRKS